MVALARWHRVQYPRPQRTMLLRRVLSPRIARCADGRSFSTASPAGVREWYGLWIDGEEVPSIAGEDFIVQNPVSESRNEGRERMDERPSLFQSDPGHPTSPRCSSRNNIPPTPS